MKIPFQDQSSGITLEMVRRGLTQKELDSLRVGSHPQSANFLLWAAATYYRLELQAVDADRRVREAEERVELLTRILNRFEDIGGTK